MVNIVGPRDEFLRILERVLDADIHVRGNEITLSGSAEGVTQGAEVLTEMTTIVRTGQGLDSSRTISREPSWRPVERRKPPSP